MTPKELSKIANDNKFRLMDDIEDILIAECDVIIKCAVNRAQQGFSKYHHIVCRDYFGNGRYSEIRDWVVKTLVDQGYDCDYNQSYGIMLTF
jgi:hypothetical protein